MKESENISISNRERYIFWLICEMNLGEVFYILNRCVFCGEEKYKGFSYTCAECSKKWNNIRDNYITEDCEDELER